MIVYVEGEYIACNKMPYLLEKEVRQDKLWQYIQSYDVSTACTVLLKCNGTPGDFQPQHHVT